MYLRTPSLGLLFLYHCRTFFISTRTYSTTYINSDIDLFFTFSARRSLLLQEIIIIIIGEKERRITCVILTDIFLPPQWLLSWREHPFNLSTCASLGLFILLVIVGSAIERGNRILLFVLFFTFPAVLRFSALLLSVQMLLRIRGKGACPENSQAALMHIRGFRHTHAQPPPRSCFTVVSTSSSFDPSSPALQMTARPFGFALFSMGIQRPSLGTQATGSPTLTPAMGPEAAQMLWKETWNAYDIVYDEVPLLPWTESSGAAADALTAVVEDQLEELARHGADATLASLAAITGQTAGFALASQLMGNKRVVVCSHYYCSAALPDSAFTDIGKGTEAATPVPASPSSAASSVAVLQEGPVVVLDLSAVPVAVAGGKLALHLAWLAAFAELQSSVTDNHARAVVVRLPYRTVPSTAQLEAYHAARGTDQRTPPEPTMANAMQEFLDFIGEHLSSLHHGFQLEREELRKEASATAEGVRSAPPLVVIGRADEDLASCIDSLLLAPSPAVSPRVVVYYGDHLSWTDKDTMSLPIHSKEAHHLRWAAALQTTSAVLETVAVPLTSLINDDEEEWDAYSLQERQRLNFCPCCSDGCHDHGNGH